jgi:hypothetical protein
VDVAALAPGRQEDALRPRAEGRAVHLDPGEERAVAPVDLHLVGQRRELGPGQRDDVIARAQIELDDVGLDRGGFPRIALVGDGSRRDVVVRGDERLAQRAVAVVRVGHVVTDVHGDRLGARRRGDGEAREPRGNGRRSGSPPDSPPHPLEDDNPDPHRKLCRYLTGATSALGVAARLESSCRQWATAATASFRARC